jgi:hypothetical protein
MASRNPFDVKYSKVEDADWQSCSAFPEPIAVPALLGRNWWQPFNGVWSNGVTGSTPVRSDDPLRGRSRG